MLRQEKGKRFSEDKSLDGKTLAILMLRKNRVVKKCVR